MALRASDLGSPPLEAHPLSLHFDLETELPSTTVAHDVRLLLPNNGPSLAHAQACVERVWQVIGAEPRSPARGPPCSVDESSELPGSGSAAGCCSWAIEALRPLLLPRARSSTDQAASTALAAAAFVIERPRRSPHQMLRRGCSRRRAVADDGGRRRRRRRRADTRRSQRCGVRGVVVARMRLRCTTGDGEASTRT